MKRALTPDPARPYVSSPRRRPRASTGRLEALDRRISRCPLCGSWRWDAECPTAHAAPVDLVSIND